MNNFHVCQIFVDYYLVYLKVKNTKFITFFQYNLLTTFFFLPKDNIITAQLHEKNLDVLKNQVVDLNKKLENCRVSCFSVLIPNNFSVIT